MTSRRRQNVRYAGYSLVLTGLYLFTRNLTIVWVVAIGLAYLPEPEA